MILITDYHDRIIMKKFEILQKLSKCDTETGSDKYLPRNIVVERHLGGYPNLQWRFFSIYTKKTLKMDIRLVCTFPFTKSIQTFR